MILKLNVWTLKDHVRNMIHIVFVCLVLCTIKLFDIFIYIYVVALRLSTAQIQQYCIGCFNRALHWRHNRHDSVSNHQPRGCLLSGLFRRRSKKISKLRVTGLCAGNSPGTGDFPAQMASNAEKVFIWWRHHGETWTKWPTTLKNAAFWTKPFISWL